MELKPHYEIVDPTDKLVIVRMASKLSRDEQDYWTKWLKMAGARMVVFDDTNVKLECLDDEMLGYIGLKRIDSGERGKILE